MWEPRKTGRSGQNDYNSNEDLGGDMGIWQVQEAKTRFSAVIDEAETQGPQIITRHGTERAVVLSIAEYRALTAHKTDLRELLLGGPKFDDFEVERDKDTGREVDL